MSFYDGPKISDSGLVLSLDAADKNSYAGSGTLWSDLSGNNKSGSLTNTPTFNSANGGSIQTNGTNSWINLGTATSIGWSSVLTISIWYNWTSFTNNTAISMWDLVNGVNQRTIICSCTATGRMSQNWSPDGTLDSTQISGSTAMSLNTWYNSTNVFRSGVRELWQNGILISSIAQPTIYTGATTNRLGMGATPGRVGDTTGGYTSIKFGTLLLYSRALSADEILQNYNAIKSRFDL